MDKKNIAGIRSDREIIVHFTFEKSFNIIINRLHLRLQNQILG